MSVINTMLRDLDRRQADGATSVQSWESRTGLTRDTMKMNDAAGVDYKQKSTSLAVLMAVLLTALVFSTAAGGWWYLTQNQAAQRPVLPAAATKLPRTEPTVPTDAPLKIDRLCAMCASLQ